MLRTFGVRNHFHNSGTLVPRARRERYRSREPNGGSSRSKGPRDHGKIPRDWERPGGKSGPPRLKLERPVEELSEKMGVQTHVLSFLLTSTGRVLRHARDAGIWIPLNSNTNPIRFHPTPFDPNETVSSNRRNVGSDGRTPPFRNRLRSEGDRPRRFATYHTSTTTEHTRGRSPSTCRSRTALLANDRACWSSEEESWETCVVEPLVAGKEDDEPWLRLGSKGCRCTSNHKHLLSWKQGLQMHLQPQVLCCWKQGLQVHF